MRIKEITLVMLMLAMATMFHAACGGDMMMDASDPSIGDVPGAEENPGGGGGGVSGPTSIDEDGNDKERDCFLDGFCYRECETAETCPAGFSCIMRVCTFNCQSDDECGTGGVCNAAGLCEADTGEGIPGCTADAECGDGRFCNDAAACEQIPVILGCQADVDCPLGQYCGDSHQCELFPGPGVACVMDEDCPGDYYCDAFGECYQDCRSSNQCAEGEACGVTGKCVVVSAPVTLTSFSFTALGAETDPAAPATFMSSRFMLSNVQITPAGRNQILTSTNYRLTGSFNY